jgi:prepilin-type N-terminal cleavage/methylation domain-containing protein
MDQVKDNQGVTLIELIVVMLMIGILSGGAFLGLRLLDSGNTGNAAKRIGASLDYTRILNMSKDKAYYMTIEQNADSFIARIYYEEKDSVTGIITEHDVKVENLKLKNGSIKYTTSTGAGEREYQVEASVKLMLSYNKATGAIMTYDSMTHDLLLTEDVKSVTINAGGHTDTILLVTATGKHYMED